MQIGGNQASYELPYKGRLKKKDTSLPELPSWTLSFGIDFNAGRWGKDDEEDSGVAVSTGRKRPREGEKLTH